MANVLGRNTPVTIGLMMTLIAAVYAGSLYVDTTVDAACETLRHERIMEYDSLRSDVNELKTTIKDVQQQQKEDNQKILLLLLDIKDGGN